MILFNRCGGRATSKHASFL
uniref:Uncharacterized protein n=1 Tax=Arundo donax TaxID=35708 RepID=A0A0A9BXQ9_ARUDO